MVNAGFANSSANFHASITPSLAGCSEPPTPATVSSKSRRPTAVSPPGWVWALPPRPTKASIEAGSTPSSRSISRMTPRRKSSWSLTCGNLRSSGASWKRLCSKREVSSSKRLTLVEVDPGLMTRMRYISYQPMRVGMPAADISALIWAMV